MRNKANHGGAGRALALLSAVVLLLGVSGGSLAAGADDDPTPVVTTTADPEPTTISTDGPADTDPSAPPTSDDPDDAVGEKPADNAPSTPADDTNPVDSDEPGPDKKDEAEDGSDTSTPDPNASTPEDDEDAGTTNTNDDTPAPGAGGDQPEQPKAGKPAGGGVSTFAAAASPFALPIGALNPTELYNENFENNTDQLYPPKMLNDYTGAGAHEYAASTYWLDKGYCNGFVTSFNVPVSQALINSTYCGKNGSGFDEGDYWAVRAKALVLGGLPGGPSAAGNNHALSMNSSGGLPSTDLNNAGSIMFQTKPATPIQINLPAGSSDGRFIAFSVDAANTQCLTDGQAFRNPKMRFQYVHNGTTADLPLGAGTYIDPCSTAGSTAFDVSSNFPGSEIGSSRQTLWNNNKGWIASGKYGTFYSGSFFLQNSSPIGLILRNVSEASSEGAGIGNPNGTQTHVKGRYNGNDGAIDNIRIVDVTPVLDKEFSPAVQSVGQTSTMTLTIYNRTDKGEKKGWEFTDTLPAGLEFVNNTVTNTCASPTSAVVNVANRTLTVTNGLLRNGDVSCTITAKVTSTSAVTYTNGKPNGNFSNVKGIDGPPNAEVAFWSGSVSWSKVDDQTPSNLLAGSVWTLSGPSPATTSAPAGGWPVGEVTDCTAWPCTGLLDQNPATGQFKVTGLPAGTYTLTEKTAPQGYELITGSFTATVSDASRDVVFTGTGVADGKIKNTRKLGMAAWEKIDDQTPAANLGGLSRVRTRAAPRVGRRRRLSTASARTNPARRPATWTRTLRRASSGWRTSPGVATR